MGEVSHESQETQFTVQEAAAPGGKDREYPNYNSSIEDNPVIVQKPKFKGYLWWVRMAIYSVFVVAGQAIAVLLGRLYFDRGGNSKWIASLVQTSGFPILIPFLFIKFPQIKTSQVAEPININPPSFLTLLSLYIFLGIFLAADCMLYSIGLVYLPVSTYSLICASQLGFNALFSFFLNAQKLTPFIINSLFLLTTSSVLLVFQPDSSDSNKVSKGKYIIGFLATLGASAGYALMLSVTQLAFSKILKKENLKVVFEMIIYQSLFATLAIMIGLFGSGEWRWFGKEIHEFELGKVAYVMTLVWTAISWQFFSIGAVGLIFEVSSLFSNVISTLGLPVVPVMAVFIFRDKMDGVKVVSMVLAIWGFVSYIYQHYIDDLETKKSDERVVNDGQLSQDQLSLVERGRTT